MGYKLHLDQCETIEEMYIDSDPKTKTETASFPVGITSLFFIVSFVMMYVLLAHLDGITKKLQISTLDMLLANEMARFNNCKKL